MAIDFAGLLDRKYANLEANTQSEANLRGAQADSMRGSLASENALRSAQAFSTTEQGKTLGPLAQSSIAATTAGIGATNAGINLTNAQTGLVGAQTGDALFGQSAASPISRINVRRQLYTNQNYGLGGGSDPGYGYAAGTPSVPAAPKGGKAPAAKGKAAAAPPMAMPGGGMTMHEVMAHAINSLHAAGGAADVPAPGQTVTNGSWEGPTMPSPAPAPPVAYPVPGAPTGGRTFGKRVSAAGGATTVPQVPTGPTPPAPGQTITSGTWGSPTPNQDLRAKMFGVKAAGGATTINAKGGKTMVPGKGPSNVDSVPATLAPKEAVLNAGAADHMGRGTIAALNALGAAKMAAQGTPPETPPTAHGVMAPARGAPSKAAAAKPIARGAVKPHGKAAPPKVAAKAKGK